MTILLGAHSWGRFENSAERTKNAPKLLRDQFFGTLWSGPYDPGPIESGPLDM